MLFRRDGVLRNSARGLMWMTIANAGAKSAKESWIHDLTAKDVATANQNERDAAAAFPSARGKRDIAGTLMGTARAAAAAAPPLQLTGAASAAQ